jgi:hypothetical protein
VSQELGLLDGKQVGDINPKDPIEDRFDQIVRPAVFEGSLLLRIQTRIASSIVVSLKKASPRVLALRRLSMDFQEESSGMLRVSRETREVLGRRERPRELRAPALEHLTKEKGRKVHRQRPARETLSLPTGNQDARRSCEDESNVKGIVEMLDLLRPPVELVNLVEEKKGWGGGTQWAAPYLLFKPPDDRKQAGFLDRLKIEPDEEHVRGCGACGEVILHRLV